MRLDLLPAPFLASLRRGGVVRIPRTHQFLGTPVEKLVAPEGDRALVLVPVVVEGALIGVAGFAAAVGSAWEQGDVDLLQLVAQGVARTRGTQARRRRAARRRRPASARCATPRRWASSWRAPSGDCLYLNPAGERIMGLTQEEAMGTGG